MVNIYCNLVSVYDAIKNAMDGYNKDLLQQFYRWELRAEIDNR